MKKREMLIIGGILGIACALFTFSFLPSLQEFSKITLAKVAQPASSEVVAMSSVSAVQPLLDEVTVKLNDAIKDEPADVNVATVQVEKSEPETVVVEQKVEPAPQPVVVVEKPVVVREMPAPAVVQVAAPSDADRAQLAAHALQVAEKALELADKALQVVNDPQGDDQVRVPAATAKSTKGISVKPEPLIEKAATQSVPEVEPKQAAVEMPQSISPATEEVKTAAVEPAAAAVKEAAASVAAAAMSVREPSHATPLEVAVGHAAVAKGVEEAMPVLDQQEEQLVETGSLPELVEETAMSAITSSDEPAAVTVVAEGSVAEELPTTTVAAEPTIVAAVSGKKKDTRNFVAPAPTIKTPPVQREVVSRPLTPAAPKAPASPATLLSSAEREVLEDAFHQASKNIETPAVPEEADASEPMLVAWGVTDERRFTVPEAQKVGDLVAGSAMQQRVDNAVGAADRSTDVITVYSDPTGTVYSAESPEIPNGEQFITTTQVIRLDAESAQAMLAALKAQDSKSVGMQVEHMLQSGIDRAANFVRDQAGSEELGEIHKL